MKRIVAILLSALLVFCTIPSISFDASVDNSASALKILQDLGAYNPTLLSNEKTAESGDNLVQKPFATIEFNDTSYAFLNEKGTIIRIKRVEEIRKQKKNGSATLSKFDSLEDLITYIEQNLIGKDYVLVNEYLFSDDTLSLRYEKRLFLDALDRYDYISVRINTSLNELETFYMTTSGFQFDKEKNVISKEKAIAAVNEILKEEINRVRLATVKINKFISTTIPENDIRLAYIVSTESQEVYVDAYTAEIIGIDVYKVVRGGAIGATDVTTASASINLAKDALENMGYTTTSKILTTQFATCVPPLLKNAFYSCSHGSATVISSRKNLSDDNRVFYASEVPSGTYKFVFLDACNTASVQWKYAFGISDYSTNKAFLGWTDTVTETASYDFCVDFWSYISSTYTVYEAAQDAADSDADKPIQFTGDTAYNGFF